MNLGGILLTLIIGAILGVIAGALYTLGKIFFGEIKSKKEYNQGKCFEIKDNQKVEDIPNNKTQLVERKEKKEKLGFLKNLFKETDIQKFQKANKELDKAKKEYEMGKITYQELKDKFEYYQNQDYYNKVLEEKYGKETK